MWGERGFLPPLYPFLQIVFWRAVVLPVCVISFQAGDPALLLALSGGLVLGSLTFSFPDFIVFFGGTVYRVVVGSSLKCWLFWIQEIRPESLFYPLLQSVVRQVPFMVGPRWRG